MLQRMKFRVKKKKLKKKIIHRSWSGNVPAPVHALVFYQRDIITGTLVNSTMINAWLLGWVSIQQLSRMLITNIMTDVLTRSASLERTDFSVFVCDEYIERKLLSFATHTRSRQGGRVGDYLTNCQWWKRQQNVLAIMCTDTPCLLEIEVCKRNVRSGSRLHSRISRSETSFPFVFCFSSRPPRNWWLNRR